GGAQLPRRGTWCAPVVPQRARACARETRRTAMQRTVERMLRTSPEPLLAPAAGLSACIHASVECAQACAACADACLAEHGRGTGVGARGARLRAFDA